MVVVADTGPLNYLVLIGVVECLRELFGRVTLPAAVRAELQHPRTPDPVYRWISNPPEWIEFLPSAPLGDLAPPDLGAGESFAIALALSLRADLILLDDRRAVAAARTFGLRAIGTIGLLDRAALRSLIDLPNAVAKLRETNFRCRPDLLEALLRDHSARNL